MQIVESTEGWPEDIEPYDLARRIQNIHHTPEDLTEGKLGDSLWQFSRYYLQAVKVSSLPHDDVLYEELAQDYTEQLQQGNPAPPIVYDSVNDRIIDGRHRLNAAIREGVETIMTYIGDVSTYSRTVE